jgi:hypothetical protein
MRNLRVLLGVLLLSSQALAEQPLTFWRYGGLRDRGELLVGLECAVARWRAAAGPAGLDVSMVGPHWVRWALPEELPDAMTPNTGRVNGPWYSTRVLINSTAEPEAVCSVLTHELMHILLRSNSHVGADGGMNWPVLHVHSSTSKILQSDIDAVCARQTCTCSNPE